MSLFSRRPAETPSGPFRFRISEIYQIPTRGVVVTGTVVDGTVQVGANAVVQLPGGAREVVVTRIETARRKRQSAEAGAEAGLYLSGLGTGDIPTVPGGDGQQQDNTGLSGVEVTSA
ncbi:EF-Tu/IF-2/RF-3 family GTPase [Amycolatopsis sp. NPDC004079]|uniref:EF-Tu/IF-2/RF-3 family GTPase n=1 Tax=Amycolatopsis sp. NPDC004079 TaxID=3154549 RepID=UPI0033A8892F